MRECRTKRCPVKLLCLFKHHHENICSFFVRRRRVRKYIINYYYKKPPIFVSSLKKKRVHVCAWYVITWYGGAKILKCNLTCRIVRTYVHVHSKRYLEEHSVLKLCCVASWSLLLLLWDIREEDDQKGERKNKKMIDSKRYFPFFFSNYFSLSSVDGFAFVLICEVSCTNMQRSWLRKG